MIPSRQELPVSPDNNIDLVYLQLHVLLSVQHARSTICYIVDPLFKAIRNRCRSGLPGGSFIEGISEIVCWELEL